MPLGLLDPAQVRIENTRPDHGPAIYDVIRRAFMLSPDEECSECIQTEDVIQQLERFPEGQFVALFEDKLLGMATTMRTSYSPDQPPLKWFDAIGDKGLSRHEPDGDWLYGVEMAVHPEYQRKGVGTLLYQARFQLVKRLNLKGWYAAGMLMGYHRVKEQMPVREYAAKVISRELYDPTVTMQMNRGFEARTLIEDYLDEPAAGNAAVLIVWHNPEYKFMG